MIDALLGSGGPFIITFRESLEAALIIGIIAAYLKKTNRNGLTKYLHVGTVAAIIASVAIGAVLASLYGSLSGLSEKLFEGTAAIVASGVLTYMIFWMAKNSGTIKEHLQKKVDSAASTGYVIGIVLVSFVAVFREGIETVLFLTATGVQNPVGTLLGAAAGIILVVVITLLMFKKIYHLDIKKFFQYSSILLIIFAAGLLGYGIHEYMEVAGDMKINMGFLSETAYDINPPAASVFHEKGAAGSVLKSLVGYDGNPEWLRVIAYMIYWIVVGLYVLVVYKPDNKISKFLRKE
ncbi:MAG: FTR1 family protein [Candidatus Aenigmatarchaeota archaeon]